MISGLGGRSDKDGNAAGWGCVVYDTDHYQSHISWIAFDDRLFKRIPESWFLVEE